MTGAAAAEVTRAALARLLEATPENPAADAEAGDVIAAAEAMMLARQPHLAVVNATPLSPETRSDAETQRLLLELRLREASWYSSLERARHQVAARLDAARRLRRY